MNLGQKNIFPVFDKIVQRSEKEAILRQRSGVFWMTGLSGSGKTTIAVALERELKNRGYLAQVLDGDNLRAGINNDLDFSETGRTENIRRISEISKLFMNCGIVTITCFVSPLESMRALARNIVGASDFRLVYINSPLEICERRDVKGLYGKARKGEVPYFTGINSPFEPPVKPDIEVQTSKMTIEESVLFLMDYILPLIRPASA